MNYSHKYTECLRANTFKKLLGVLILGGFLQMVESQEYTWKCEGLRADVKSGTG